MATLAELQAIRNRTMGGIGSIGAMSEKAQGMIDAGQYDKPFWQLAEEKYPTFQRERPAQGTSAWERNMLERLGIEGKSAWDRAAATGASQLATGQSRLAMRGGISSGARERMASDSMRNMLMARSEQNRQQAMARLGIGAQAEEQATREMEQQRAYELERYKALLGAQAAERQAVATENSGK